MWRKKAQSLDSLGSSVSQELAHPDDQILLEEDEDLDEDALGICFTTTESKCEELYEQGMLLKSQGQLETALACFVESLKRMQECHYFAKLPHTLHELAELYHAMERYDKAVEFAQAEKLFYEAVLIDYHGRRRDGKGIKRGTAEAGCSDPANYGDLLVKKASEFEELSRLCARDKKFQLALDYCGKAAKIRQSVFGQEHPSTIATLEYFTQLYAEVGRIQYTTAMHSMNERIENTSPPQGETVDNVDQEASSSTIEEADSRERPEGEENRLSVNQVPPASVCEPSYAQTDGSIASPSPVDDGKTGKNERGGQEVWSLFETLVYQIGYYAPLWLIIIAAVVMIGLTFA